MYGIILIGVMIVTGGAIAFIGDKLGTKVGKKRLSIFGLRPRHTSMIVTVITGGLITALTMGALAVTSENVRTALFGMEELNATMAATKIKLGEVTDELSLTQEELLAADEDLTQSKDEIETLKAEQEELAAESERLKEGNEQLEQEKSELTAENKNLADTNSALEDSNKKLSASNTNLSAENEQLTKNNSDLEEHAKNLREGLIAMREGDIIFKAGEVLSSGVIKANQSAEKIAADINQLADDATRNISARFGETIDSSVWIYQPELNKAIETISKSNQDMVLRITAAGNLVRGEPIRTTLSLYKNDSVFDKGEFVFAKNYDVTKADDAEFIMQNFLAEINRVAVTKGILADPINGSVGVIDGDQLYNIIDTISKVRGKVYLSAYAKDATTSIGPLRLNIKVGQKRGV